MYPFINFHGFLSFIKNQPEVGLGTLGFSGTINSHPRKINAEYLEVEGPMAPATLQPSEVVTFRRGLGLVSLHDFGCYVYIQYTVYICI